MIDHNWFSSLNDLKYKLERGGNFFFSPNTMRFFNSRSLPTLYGKNRIFITSEKNGEERRLYSLRIVERKDDKYGIDTIGDFQAFLTSHSAKRVASYVGTLDRAGLLPDYFEYGMLTALAHATGVNTDNEDTGGWSFDIRTGFSKNGVSVRGTASYMVYPYAEPHPMGSHNE